MSDTDDDRCFYKLVEWSPNMKFNLIGEDHGLKHLISPEMGHKHVTHLNPSPGSTRPLILQMKEPSVLLLRGCRHLLLPPASDFPFHKFKTLIRLEISGVAHLRHLPDDALSQMSHLESLNLSHLPIQRVPPSLFPPLKHLRSLTIKGCPDLHSLPPLGSLRELEHLDISHLPAVEQLDDSFLSWDNEKLSWVVFRGCSKLRRLPRQLSLIRSLEVLDVSHCTVMETENGRIISPRLRMLDVSYSPAFLRGSSVDYNSDALTHLFLREVRVDYISTSTSLQVLDLCGVQNVGKIMELLLQSNRHLVALDLSRTDIECLDFLAPLVHLHSLVLSRCTRLLQLPAMGGLTNLELLDVSGCENLADLPRDVSSLTNLKDLNLSGCSSLQQLRDSLFDQMSSLERLDLSNTHFTRFPSFSNLTRLQLLNLSQTSVAQVLCVSELVSLKELLLANCQRLQVMPDVRALTNLETLDLSLPHDHIITPFQVEVESHSQRGQFLSDPSRLRKLVLTNRPGLLELFHEASPNNVQCLDLRGIDVIGVQPSGSGKGSLQEAIDVHPSSKCDEIHLVSTFFSPSSGCDRFSLMFSDLEDHISEIHTKVTNNNVTRNGSNQGSNQTYVFKRGYGSISDDLKYIRQNISLLESSGNGKCMDMLMHELMDVANDLSKVETPLDHAKLNELLRIIVKLKLLVPWGQAEEMNDEIFPKSQWDNFSGLNLGRVTVSKEEEIQEAYGSLEEIEKNCLFYFSTIPSTKKEDLTESFRHSRIQKRKLIQLWICEGLIEPHHASAVKGVEKAETVEEIGKQILNVLKQKKLIVPLMFDRRDTGSYIMHPSVHSFVTLRAVEAGFFDSPPKNGKLPRHPHLSGSKRACLLKSQGTIPSSCRLWASYGSSSKKLERFRTMQALFNIDETMIDIKSEWFSKLSNLRVLHLGNLGCQDVEHIEVADLNFLDELKNMKQLRLLSLEGFSALSKLPDSVCELTNLRILNLQECGYLDILPNGIGSLKSLTHLDLTDSRLLSMLPKGISLLSQLEVLKGFVIYYHEGGQQHRKACTLRDLLKLKKLRKLNVVVNRDQFPGSSDLLVLQNMEGLRNLSITWQSNYNTHDAFEPEAVKHSRLLFWKKHERPLRSSNLNNLRKLVMCCFPLEGVPDWLDPSEMRNLKKLYIIGGKLKTLVSANNNNPWSVVEHVRLKYSTKSMKRGPSWKHLFPNMKRLDEIESAAYDLEFNAYESFGYHVPVVFEDL